MLEPHTKFDTTDRVDHVVPIEIPTSSSLATTDGAGGGGGGGDATGYSRGGTAAYKSRIREAQLTILTGIHNSQVIIT